MSDPSPSRNAVDRKPTDIRQISLATLHQLAKRGSQRARAELERRMRAADNPSHRQTHNQAQPQRQQPNFDEAAHTPSSSAAMRNSPPETASAQLAERLTAIAQQESQQERASGPPRLIGMLMIGWALMFLAFAFVMVGHRSALYFLYCAVSAGVIGWLLMQCSHKAIAVHALLLVCAIIWSWLDSSGDVLTTVLQAVPLLLPAGWMAIAQVREPLG